MILYRFHTTAPSVLRRHLAIVGTLLGLALLALVLKGWMVLAMVLFLAALAIAFSGFNAYGNAGQYGLVITESTIVHCTPEFSKKIGIEEVKTIHPSRDDDGNESILVQTSGGDYVIEPESFESIEAVREKLVHGPWAGMVV